MKINIEDYLSTEEIKEIVKSEVRFSIQKHIHEQKDLERILYNSVHQFIEDKAGELLPEDLDVTLAAKVVEVVNGLSSHTVFSPPDAWDRAATKGWKLLQLAVNESDALIKERVEQLVRELKPEKVMELMEDVIYQVFLSKKP